MSSGMGITFNGIHLGHSATQLDPFEGNDVAEGAAPFVGKSYGSAGNPLSARVTQATAIDTGGVAGAAWRGRRGGGGVAGRWIRTTRPRTISSPLTLAGGGLAKIYGPQCQPFLLRDQARACLNALFNRRNTLHLHKRSTHLAKPNRGVNVEHTALQ